MACFLAPVAEAIVVSIVNKRLEKKAQKEDLLNPGEVKGLKTDIKEHAKTPFTRKLRWLTNMLWGGSLLLLVEHIWHGEIVPWPPFLTAMESPAETSAMLGEIATVGVAMAALITGIWGIMVAVSSYREKKAEEMETADLKEV